MKVGKPISKRVPVRLRHKIQKKSAAKQRKERKEAKKNPQWRSRLKKDPGIPNLFPYKDKILAEIEENKRRKEEDVRRRRETAKAQRQGTAVTAEPAPAAEDEDEELRDPETIGEDDEMDVQDSSNPMAALLASAQARASAYTNDGSDSDSDSDQDVSADEWSGIASATTTTTTTPASTHPTKKVLPKQALADPIQAVSALLDRMQKTTDGIQRLITHYNLPPLVTAGAATTSRFLVEVARKRGRLGRGGVPNLNAAALTVLDDLNQERLVLPAVESVAASAKAPGGTKSEVQIVREMAAPFRIEGLFGDGVAEAGEAMAVET
ncbi:GTPase grn1 [Teratosphaeria destructans]|uniref:GTPase grn1 n=1 Tax=Teratosphaeria destructans TaxID=418781 RepID=A0A9W7SZP4_9PEZI|nr:GTPase grn1 [Teratosphaeria destructans]